jgi:hypothetical protein
VPHATLSESQFLAQQAHSARLVIGQTLKEIRAGLAHGANPAAWAGEHPWITISAAAIAGFLATAALVPSKEQQALNKLAKIERALNPPPPPANGKPREEKRGLLGAILLEAVTVLRPAVSSLLAANIAPPSPNPPPSDQPDSAPTP